MRLLRHASVIASPVAQYFRPFDSIASHEFCHLFPFHWFAHLRLHSKINLLCWMFGWRLELLVQVMWATLVWPLNWLRFHHRNEELFGLSVIGLGNIEAIFIGYNKMLKKRCFTYRHNDASFLCRGAVVRHINFRNIVL